MNRIVFSDGDLKGLRSRLLVDAPLESAGAIIARVGLGVEGMRFVVIGIQIAEDADYLERSEIAAVLRPDFIARALKQARIQDAALFLVHTHPMQSWPQFSVRDAQGEHEIASTIYQRAPKGPHGSLVFGTNGFAARLFDTSGKVTDVVEALAEVGRNVEILTPSSAQALDEMFDRNVRALGAAGQRLLNTLHIAIVGVGGTGSFAVEELARLGVGRLTLIDDEVIERTNLNRVVGSTIRDVGRPKVDVLAEVAGRARSDVKVTNVRGSILHETVARRLIDCDAIFCCTDSHGSRAVINQIACQYLVPLIDIGIRIDAVDGSVTGATSRVQMVAPGLACLACHPLLSPEAVRHDLMSTKARDADPYIVGFQEPQPAVVSINGAATSAAVTMFLTALTGLPGTARHLVGRPLEGTVRVAIADPTQGCVVCGRDNAFSRADSWPLMWTQ